LQTFKHIVIGLEYEILILIIFLLSPLSSHFIQFKFHEAYQISFKLNFFTSYFQFKLKINNIHMLREFARTRWNAKAIWMDYKFVYLYFLILLNRLNIHYLFFNDQKSINKKKREKVEVKKTENFIFMNI
jgi:hypothetical protein